MGPVSSEPGADSRTTAKSPPLALEVPVVATGARPGDESEKRELFTEETETVLVLEHGAVIRLSAAVAVGQLVFLTNKQTGKEIVTQVLRKRSDKPTSCYVELDFTEAAPGFWGVEFPKADTDAKPSVLEGGEAAEVAEAEVTEEEFATTIQQPSEAEVARLRREVQELKAQLKAQAAPVQSTEMQQPSDSELENLKSLLGSKALSKEPEEEEKPEAAKTAPAKLEIMSPHEPKPEPVKSEGEGQEETKPGLNEEAEQTSPYPIRMQLPKATETSNRASEFAADSAAITAAIEDHLLPKTSLDFEKFPGLAEPKTKLYSGKATRSLSGPIGMLVAVVRLLIAAGITVYQFGWLPKFGGRSPKSAASTHTMAGPVAVVSSNEQTDPPKDFDVAKADPAPVEKPPAAANNTHAAAAELPAGSAGISSARVATESLHEATTASKSNVRPAPEKRTAIRTASPKSSANELAATTAKVEGDVIVEPKLIKGRRSLSPPEALRGYVSGNVVMDAVVDETGHVQSATVASGRKELHQRALDTVKEYLYQPAMKNGKPVSAHVAITIQFWYEP